MIKSRVRRRVIWGSKSGLGFEPSQNWRRIELLSTLACVALGQFQTNLGKMKLSAEVLALFPKNGASCIPGNIIQKWRSIQKRSWAHRRCSQERSIRSRPSPKSVAPSTTGWLRPMVAASLAPGRCTKGPHY